MKATRSLGILFTLALLLLQGCTSFNVQNAIPVSMVPNVSDIDPEYLIQVGDTIRVAIRTYDDPRNPDIQNVNVRPDGKAFFDMIEDEVLLAGYTPRKVRDLLLEKYSKVIKNPSVSVNLAAFGPRNIYVGGETRDIEIEHSFKRGQTALRAILMVGYDTYRADLDRVIILRQGQNGEKPTVMQLKLTAALRNEDHSQDVALRPNDVVFIPPKGIVQAGDLVAQIDALVPFKGIVYPVGSAWLIDEWGIGSGSGEAAAVAGSGYASGGAAAPATAP